MSLPLRFGPHLLEAVLAGGHSGLLFQARESEGAGRTVVIKIPYVYLQRTPGFRQAFLERMAPFAERQCPGLVRVLGTGKTHGLAWVSTEYAAGTDMGTLLVQMQAAGRRPTPRQVLTVGLRLGNILSALHAAPGRNGPMVHAELRPSKILFTPDGGISLLPPGAITTAAAERGPAGSAARFAWRAPEQLMRVPESVRTDVRGLALLLLVLATGSNPFQRRTTARTLSAILQDQVMLEGDSELTPELSGLLRGAMASDPDRRPKDVPSFLEALKQELARIGGEAKAWEWRSFVEAVRQAPAPPMSPDDAKLVSERDALLARLVRDARKAEALDESSPTASAPGDGPKLGEPSGFTLVPEDNEPITQEVEADTAPNLAIQAAARLAIDGLSREESTEDEDTADAARNAERAPTPRHAEAVYAAQGAVDSSFVLVEDNTRRVGDTLQRAGGLGNPAVPDSRVTAPPTRIDDEDSIPTLDVEEGQSLISAGRRAPDEAVEAEESRPADPDDEPASVRVPAEPGVQAPPRPDPTPVTAPVVTRPPERQRTEPIRSPERQRTEPIRAPERQRTEPMHPTEPIRPTEPIAEPPPTRSSGQVTAPRIEQRNTDSSRPPRIRPTERPPEPSANLRWIVPLTLLLAVGLGGYFATRNPPSIDPAEPITVSGPANPPPAAGADQAPIAPPVGPETITAPPPVEAVAVVVAPPGPTEPAPTGATGPGTKPPGKTPGKSPSTTGGTDGTTSRSDPAPAVIDTSGPPAVKELKQQVAENKVTIVVRGSSLGRPDQQKVGRPGDGDQYIFQLPGAESKLGWTRQPINSDLVSGVEVLSSPEGTQIRVNTGTVPYNVVYAATADGFKFSVIRKTTPL